MTRNNLQPTVITDKNGKITTVHKKQDGAKSSRTVIPAPALDKPKPLSNAARVREIVGIFQSKPGSGLIKSKVQRFINYSTPEQLQVLDEALMNYDCYSQHEQAAIRSSFVSLSTNYTHDSTIHEQLSLRSAFLSERSMAGEPFRNSHFLSEYVLGVRFTRKDDYDYELDSSDEKAKRENIALLRFAFELNLQAPHGGFLPTYKTQTHHRSHIYAKVYDSHDLTDLIIEKPESVDELIEIALTNETCDGNRLRTIIEHEGHASLSSGAL